MIRKIGRVLRYALTWGCIAGSICFILGYVGPIILKPEANQGPLLGLFVTGPAGFLVGFMSALAIAIVRERRRK